MNITKISMFFNIKGTILEARQIKTGHINRTYIVKTKDGNKNCAYIVQRINKYVFKDPVMLMENVQKITDYMKNKYIAMGINPERLVLNFMKSINGESCLIDDDGEYWRCYEFVDNSITYNLPETDYLMENIGVGFGNFHYMLSGFDASLLTETIKGFHYTKKRIEDLFEAIEKDEFNRAKNVKEAISYYKEKSALASSLCDTSLPLRVTHNDAKCNNVLFDVKTNKPLAVIDLDTVMPGLMAFDFGDAVRSACNTCNEDEPNYDKVILDIDKFKCFTKGFMSKVSQITSSEEKESLAIGVFAIAVELSARFMTDYLTGDKYFDKDYENHNMVRALSQLALAKDVEKKLLSLEKIIKGF